jgi:hypothetical protein
LNVTKSCANSSDDAPYTAAADATSQFLFE